ncbi:MAG: IclR family transcriptional regulator [Burkholderiaceae bacterium]
MATSMSDASSRRRTRQSGVFVRDSPKNRSLERGLQILRVFRIGGSGLGNAEIALRTGLPRSTVSRLTRTLVDTGFLAYDVDDGAYRPGLQLLSLGEAARQGSEVLRAALPTMHRVARKYEVNVGLATVDGDEVVYLESVRRSRRGVFRHMTSGMRIPVADTALGQAWLAGVDPATRDAMIPRLAMRHGEGFDRVEAALARAIGHVDRHGWCGAVWIPGMMSVATPLRVPGQAVHAINVSYPVGDDPADGSQSRYVGYLFEARDGIREALGLAGSA